MCVLLAEKEKKLSDSFSVIYPKPPKMTIFGIKMAAKPRRTIQSTSNLASLGDIGLYIVPAKEEKKLSDGFRDLAANGRTTDDDGRRTTDATPRQ